jgi:hypothetical protein
VAPANLIQLPSGAALPQEEIETKLALLAEDIAIALAHPGTRNRVYQALKDSKIRENKLHFRTLLQRQDVDLLTQMARRHGDRTDLILARLDSVVDLEFYMPVPEHRGVWKGGSDLLVVSYPNDDGSQPRGFNLRGQEVPVSAFVPPDVPTLVIVPVETDFARDTLHSFLALATADPDPVTGPQWYMTQASISDSHEGWGLGSPEFEVHVFLQQSTGLFSDRWCAAERMPAPYYWDMNSTTWYGRVTLATENFLGNTRVQYQMWEDDNDPCATHNGQMSGGLPPKTTSDISGSMQDLFTRVVDIYRVLTSAGTWTTKISPLAGNVSSVYQIVSSLNKDDFVGDMKAPSCWPSGGADATFYIYADRGATYKGATWINTDYGQKDPVCAPPPPSLSVSISGPSEITACGAGTYTASVSNGTPPYTIQWLRDGTVIGSGSTLYLYGQPAGTFVLTGRATDSVGVQGSDSKWVTVSQC